MLSVALVVLLASAPAISSETDDSTFVFEGPKVILAREVFGLIAPGEDQQLATLIGLQKWMQKENSYSGMLGGRPGATGR